MMQKQCIICKQMYVSFLPNRQKTCSPACRKIYQKEYLKSPYVRNYRNVWQKDWYHKNHPTFCRICGEPILCTDGQDRPKQLHDECVISDCKKTLRAGERLTPLQRNRLVSRGYTITEFRQAIDDGFV